MLAVFFTTVVGQHSCGSQLPGLQGTLTHTEYPEDYKENTNCEWSTDANPRDDVTISFSLLKIEADRDGACSYDYLM